MLDLIAAFVSRVRGLFPKNENLIGTASSAVSEPVPVSEVRSGLEEPIVDLSRWTITLHEESPFEKVGRLYLEGTNLIIRSEIDGRGFFIGLADVAIILDGDSGPIRLLSDGSITGTAKKSTSGLAMNFTIAPFFYTMPLRSLNPVLDEQVRKAPLFVGRDQVEPG
jgi:hypothetical protein